MQLKWNGESTSVWLIGLLALLWARNWVETLLLFGLIFCSLFCYGFARTLVASRRFKRSLKVAAQVPYTPARDRKEALVKLAMGSAGTLTSLSLFAALILCAGNPSPLARSLQMTAFFNLYWALLHLLPIPPFDGWCCLCGGMELLFGLRGYACSYLMGAGVSAALAIATLYVPSSITDINRALLMSLFGFLAHVAFVKWQAVRDKSPIDFDVQIQERLDRAHRDVLSHQLPRARDALRQVAGQLPEESCSYLRAKFIEALALRLEGRLEQAHLILSPLEKRLRGETLALLHELAYKLGKFTRVCRLSARVHEDRAKPHIAVMNGLAFAHCKELNSALNWLLAAKRGGYQTKRLLDDALFQSWSPKALRALR